LEHFAKRQTRRVQRHKSHDRVHLGEYVPRLPLDRNDVQDARGRLAFPERRYRPGDTVGIEMRDSFAKERPGLLVPDLQLVEGGDTRVLLHRLETLVCHAYPA
jgi:hypothetical protein